MKKLLLASAIAALSVSAQAAPQVYGKAFLTADYTDLSSKETLTGATSATKSDSSGTQLNSIASRIGVKGAEALTANTDVVYQLEYRVEVDNDGTGGDSSDGLRNFESRDTYLGLSNKQYGTFLAGRLTSIDDHINYANVLAGGVVGGDNVLSSFNGDRLDNAFAYISPNYSGATFMAMHQTDGSDDRDGNNFGNGGFGVGVKFEPNGAPYRAGATYIQATGNKIARVSGSYNVNSTLTVGALYQNHNFGKGFEKENTFSVSGEYKTATPWTVYGQVDLVQDFNGAKDAEKQRFAVGGKYAFNKATTGHVYGAYLDETKIAKFNDDKTVILSRTDRDGFGIGAGLEYKF